MTSADATTDGDSVELDALHGAIIDIACDGDRQWFLSHPRASEYIRPAVKHEFCLPGEPCQDAAGVWAYVIQLAPGVRYRFEVRA